MLACGWDWILSNADGIQSILILLSVIAAFSVIWHNGKISRRKATIEMVAATFFGDNGDELYKKFKNIIKAVELSGADIAEYAAKNVSDDKKSDAEIILNQLNQYELISLSIKKRVFDEGFYKYWFFSQFMRDFTKLKPFIDRVRLEYSNNAYFCEYEALAGRWRRNKHPVKHPSKLKIVWWVLRSRDNCVRQALEASI